MRKFLLFILYAITMLQVMDAQEISPSVRLEDGTMVGKEYVFKIGDNPTFTLTNPNERCDWTLAILQKDGKSIEISESGVSSFKIDFDKIPYEYWRNALRIQDGDNRLFTGFLMTALRNSDGLTFDQVYLSINLLPSFPKIISGELSGEYDWEWDVYDATFRLVISCSQVDELRIGITEENLFTLPDRPFYQLSWGFSNLENRKVGDSLYEIDCLAGWGTYFDLTASNRYGSIMTKPDEQYCTTCYITDEKVLERIEELRNEYGGLDNVDNNKTTVIFKDNCLTFIDGSDITEVEMYDVYGNLKCRQYDGLPIDCSCYQKGIYIVRYIINSHQSFTNKIAIP